MSTQYIASASVYTGTWINWTDGLIKGSTLTVSSRDGGFLIAFLAWFVGVAGNAFWDILSSVIFLSRATELPRDAFYQQQQMSLRVGVSGFSTMWSFWNLARQWHRRANDRWSHSWPIICTALIYIISFTAAGILVSKVAQTRSEVILNPTICGLWDDPWAGGTLSDAVAADEWSAKQQQILDLAGNFASSCYTFNKSTSARQSCLAYGRSNAVWNVTANVQCPFTPEMCRQGKSVLMDSGLIDSHLLLGINSRIEDRVQFRQQFHCSPLAWWDYGFSTTNMSDPRLPPPVPGVSYALYNVFQYGAALDSNFLNQSVASQQNVTYVWNNYSFGSPGNNVGGVAVYLFNPEIAFLDSPDTTFLPIPQLEQTDADLTIVWLITQAHYAGPVEDPWFEALTPYTVSGNDITITGAYNVTYYLPTAAASPMGCIARYQWCKNEGRICTTLTGNSLGGRTAFRKSIPEGLRLNPRQRAIFNRMYSYAWNTVLYDIATVVNSNTLLAAAQAAPPDVPALPENQWILEVDHWFGLSLTALQLQNVNYVLGDGSPNHNKYMKQVEGDSEWMCHNQIVQRDDFTSFSILGIVLIFLLGGSFLIIDLCLEPLIASWYRKIQPGKVWKLQAWRGNRFLQVQSQAFEAKGLGIWERTTSEIPVTKDHETFTSPFSLALPEDVKTKSNTKKDRWWRKLQIPLIHAWTNCQQQGNHGKKAQSVAVTEVPSTPQELLPPIPTSTLQPFVLDVGELPIRPQPGHDRPHGGDTEITP